MQPEQEKELADMLGWFKGQLQEDGQWGVCHSRVSDEVKHGLQVNESDGCNFPCAIESSTSVASASGQVQYVYLWFRLVCPVEALHVTIAGRAFVSRVKLHHGLSTEDAGTANLVPRSLVPRSPLSIRQ
jgi:hypothetical protein